MVHRIRFTLPRLLPVAGLLVLLASPYVQAEAPKEQWHTSIATGYGQLVETTEKLNDSARHYCEAPDKAKLDQVKEAWADGFHAWQAVRFVDFGPIQQNSLAWQFQFWPDQKNLIAKKVDAWVEGEQKITVENLAGDSVAVKGFPAIEYMLFDPRLEGKQLALPHPRTCEMLTTVTSLMASNAQSLRNDWATFKSHYLSTGDYGDATVLAAMHALETIKNKRLGAPMGLGGSRRNAYLGDAWRSDQSLAALHSSLKGVQQYFVPGLKTLMQNSANQALFDEFESQLARTLERFADLPNDLAAMLEEDNGYRQLQFLYIDVERLSNKLSRDIAPELGVVKGFNSSDGD